MPNATTQPAAQRQGGPLAEISDEIDLMALLSTVWRGKWWIAFSTIIAILIGGYYAYEVAVPMYTSKAVVMLENRDEQVTDITSVVSGLSGDQATINTEVEVLRSRNLVEKVVLALDLVSDPEFNGSLRPQSVYTIGALIKRLRGNNDIIVERSDREILDSVINSVLGVLSISNVRQSYVFQITAVTTSAEKSARIANKLAELYILDQLEVKFDATEQATSWLTDRVSELKTELETAEAKAKAFDTDAELVSPEALAALGRQLKDMRDRVENTRSVVETRDARIVSLQTAANTGDAATMMDVADDRTLSRLFGLVEAGTAERSVFDARFAQIVLQAEQERARAAIQYEAFKTSILELETQIENQSADLVALQQLQREAEASRLIYEYFLGRLKETSVQQGIQQADSRVLSRAVVPTSASAPRRSMILALSLMLGFFSGSGLVLLREMLQNTFRTAEDLEGFTGYTVMGQVPVIPAKARRNILDYVLSKPSSRAVEAVRNLRTSILLSNVDSPPKIVMSTSSLPAEGKTTQSLMLAQNMAAIGKKVLLIEGDIRRRVFAEYFDIKTDKGLVSVLSGAATLPEVLHREERLNLDVLIGEKPSINAADLFSSGRFESFLNEMRESYDLVVIDTPPVLIVPDARVIGQFVDAIIYTVKWDQTSKTQVRQGLKMFESVGLKVTGLVLGQVSTKGMKRYGYGHYGAYGNAKGYYEN